jgi:glycosyltransferase involved in cell wall biosynthesis
VITVLTDGLIYGLQNVGGISRYFTEILSRLGNEAPEIRIVLHLPPPRTVQVPHARGITELRDWNSRPHRVFRQLGKVRARVFAPQIFHSTYYTLPYWSGLRSVLTVYDYIHEEYHADAPAVRAFVERKKHLIESADAVIAISESTRKDILSYTRAEESKVSVIYPAVSELYYLDSAGTDGLTEFRQRHDMNSPYLLYVGQRKWYKNFTTLLRAFVRIASQVDGHLVAVGGEPLLESWQADLIARHRLQERIHLLPRLTDQDLFCAYKGAAAFVFPSFAEGFGIPLLEAMSCGTPAIVSDIPVFHEIAGECAVYFNPHDHEALAHVLLRALSSSTFANQTSMGRRRARDFSWDVAARKLAEVYRGLA